MNNWHSFPFLRFVFFLILGILSAVYFSISWENTLGIFSISFIIFNFYFWKKNFKKSSWNIPILCFCIGYLLTFIHTDKNYSSHFSNYNFTNFTAKIYSKPIEKNKSLHFTVEVIKLQLENQNWIKSNGKIKIYLKENTSVHYGQKLLISQQPRKIEIPKNPAEFNFKRYLAFDNIEYQCILKGHETMVFTSKTQWNILAFSQHLRQNFVKSFKKHISNQKEFSILVALLLGDKHYIENETKNDYSGAGAMHILAVSGLHVGILFGVLSFLLNLTFLKNHQKTSAFLLISFLWFYAFLTGLSPSILRASLMFSFVIIAKTIDRNSNIYNTLALTAFCLLIYNPYFLMEVGFQLSFLAVFGIVFFFEKFYQLFTFDNKLIDFFWQLLCISIAAQLITFPLTILSFHQFPTYFFLVNLLIIPIAMLIVVIGFFSLFFSYFDWLFSKFSWVLEFLTKILNEIISFSQEKLPFATIEGIDISIIESYLFYLLIFLMYLFFMKKKLRFLLLSTLLIIGLSSFNIYESLKNKEQDQLSIYYTPHQSNLVFCKGSEHFLIGDEKLIENKSLLKFRFFHHWWKQGTTKQHFFTWNENTDFQKSYENYNIIVWQKTKILVIKNRLITSEQKLFKNITFDLIIVQNQSISSLRNFKSKQIIFDNSNSFRFCKKVTKKDKNIIFMPLRNYYWNLF